MITKSDVNSDELYRLLHEKLIKISQLIKQ
jgi:hypothetical protein